MSEKVVLGQQQSNVQAQPRPGESGYTPPVDRVPLPSKGKIYPVGTSLFNAEWLEIKSMTAEEEDILSSRGLLRSGKALGALMQACLCDKSIDPEKMVSGDRNAVLTAIRIAGYGSDYKVEVTCPQCDKKFKKTFDLAKFEIKPLTAEPVQEGQNLFSIELPITKKTCLFKLLSGEDERELSVTLERTKAAYGPQAVDPSVSLRLYFNIVQLGDERDRGKLREIVKNLPARDSRKLRKYIEEISPDINMKQIVTCLHCSENSEVTVPMGTEFFWPDA